MNERELFLKVTVSKSDEPRPYHALLAEEVGARIERLSGNEITGSVRFHPIAPHLQGPSPMVILYPGLNQFNGIDYTGRVIESRKVIEVILFDTAIQKIIQQFFALKGTYSLGKSEVRRYINDAYGIEWFISYLFDAYEEETKGKPDNSTDIESASGIRNQHAPIGELKQLISEIEEALLRLGVSAIN